MPINFIHIPASKASLSNKVLFSFHGFVKDACEGMQLHDHGK